MEPVTMAIVAALTAGAVSGLTDTAKVAIADTYGKFKELLQKKFGHEEALLAAVEGLEAKPASTGRRQTLEEEMSASPAGQDPEIVQVAQQMLQQIRAQPGGERYMLHVVGNYNAVVQGTGDATVNVNAPRQP